MNRAAMSHPALSRLAVEDDELLLGGRTLTALAEQVGQTPFYAYDRDAITRRVDAVRATIPREVSLHYAVKANPMPAVVDHCATLVDGFDVASLGEMRTALDTGMPAEEISIAGPGKRREELRAAVAAGVTVNVESPGELERLAEAGEAAGRRPRAAVRVNPDFELKSSGMKMSGGPKQFGIDAEEVPGVLGRLGELGLHFRGLHIFSGSQNLSVASLVEAQNATFDLAYRLAEDAPAPLEMLNIGGGFGIPYFPGEEPLDIAACGENLERRVEECRDRLGAVEVMLELGRYLVGEAGVYACRVLDRKVSRGHTFLVTDGGLHHHLAASGNFGQVIRKNYPVVTPRRVHDGPRETVSVVGPLCTPLDLLADRVEMGRAEEGDLVAVLQSGAYGYSASPHRFLGHPPPEEVLV
ncbi:diaminopimelate decarboxylase [Thiohalorhabdus denitrificans]|uniref:Diaminopimelate decarboxylase n=1 Tax=Thiohalorhabdus denitrificans TaxID=381306 RepID=A0A0P9GJ08_9GAMM|nr:pyridoxal-dependent decarboxylase, exosortase A system-associated [Thiohalorhabdus denitrificans]KPV40031.1 diaminopimelate decarboxylase [Thiohalorhabdus denitrificans]SCY12913.1 diaminopimelate decarboxylase [Thiohalorhabdus denitrificans]